MHIDLDEVEFVTETAVTIRGSRRRTTIPKEISDRMRLVNADRLRWALLKDGTVFVTHVRKVQTQQAGSSREGEAKA
jgi:hypothetical protein